MASCSFSLKAFKSKKLVRSFAFSRVRLELLSLRDSLRISFYSAQILRIFIRRCLLRAFGGFYGAGLLIYR